MSGLTHFSKISEEQMDGMCQACTEAAIEYAKSIGMSGLSENGVFSVYRALQEAVRGEWEASKLAQSRSKRYLKSRPVRTPLGIVQDISGLPTKAKRKEGYYWVKRVDSDSDWEIAYFSKSFGIFGWWVIGRELAVYDEEIERVCGPITALDEERGY